MNPLMRYTLAKFDGRCGGSWCPVSDPPVMCDLETAHICYARLQIGSLVPGADTCRYVSEKF
ncbi:hypothetical protein DPMN_098262 [Dreissena polymorpha]|uniref:Uncharacterized protein n=1 Tax=Dreissena polymorpha TaxID=45954 RepID=A0A9D4R6H8_DREPO|nr:hypothetical protein DPMN_098262 [Dreissena polymorpha]